MIRDNFYDIVDQYIMHDEFKKLKNINHHGITRYDHSLRVAYYTYIVTRFLHLHYKEATKAAVLHDFFTDEVEEERSLFKLRRHPKYAVDNALKYFELNELEKDIISTHMFPVTFTPPKYLESWIVDIIDDICAVYEKVHCVRRELRAAFTFLFIVFINYIK